MGREFRRRFRPASVRTLICLLPVLALVASCTRRDGDPSRERRTGAEVKDSLVELTVDTFARRIEAGGYHFVDFAGKRCIPCVQMRPVLQKLARNHPPLRVSIVYMENSPELLEEWRIQLVPTQVVIGPKGKEITRHVGFWSYGEIVTELKKRGIVS